MGRVGRGGVKLMYYQQTYQVRHKAGARFRQDDERLDRAVAAAAAPPAVGEAWAAVGFTFPFSPFSTSKVPMLKGWRSGGVSLCGSLPSHLTLSSSSPTCKWLGEGRAMEAVSLLKHGVLMLKHRWRRRRTPMWYMVVLCGGWLGG